VQPVTSCKVAGTTQKQCQASEVSMQIDNLGLPIHKDATFSIRPRIFLEGNFFVDVHPGTPSAPIAPDGWTFPINAGAEPVQFDQVLGSLQGDTRHNLQLLLRQYGSAVQTGGPGYNRSIQYWLPAYKNSSIVAHDFLGIHQHDLSTWIAQMGPVAGAIDAHPQNLQSLITDFNTTANAFARENRALQSAVAELPRTLGAAVPALNALNAAFPPTRAFARALTPGVVSSGPTIDASLPFIHQLRLLVQPAELRGLTADLAVAVPALARLTVATIPLMRKGVRPLSSCVSNVIYPWSQLTLDDHVFTGQPGIPPRKVYVEGVDFLPGLAGESRVFDANGPYVRIIGTGGTFAYSLSAPNNPAGKLVGTALAQIAGEQPQPPPGAKRPPLHSRTPCETQPAITDLSTPVGSPVPQLGSASDRGATSASSQQVVQRAIAQLRNIAKTEGIKVAITGIPTASNAPRSGKPRTSTTGTVSTPTGTSPTASSTTTAPATTPTTTTGPATTTTTGAGTP
jgi:hypothetical protein